MGIILSSTLSSVNIMNDLYFLFSETLPFFTILPVIVHRQNQIQTKFMYI